VDKKRLYDFATNLFRKLRTKFYQNHRSFVEDITRNVLVSLFSRTHCILRLWRTWVFVHSRHGRQCLYVQKM